MENRGATCSAAGTKIVYSLPLRCPDDRPVVLCLSVPLVFCAGGEKGWALSENSVRKLYSAWVVCVLTDRIGRCPVTGCLTPAQTLHVSTANYRRSCCCALALHALDAHGCHGVSVSPPSKPLLTSGGSSSSSDEEWSAGACLKGTPVREEGAVGSAGARCTVRDVQPEPVLTWCRGNGRVGDPYGSMCSSATAA
jgi:hypothetical protein